MSPRATNGKGGSPAAGSVTSKLRRDAELARLARVLGTEEDALAVLDAADEAALRELRFAVGDHFYRRFSVGLRPAANLASKLPAPLAAKIAEHALGPVLSGAIVPLLDVGMLPEITRRMSPAFLADTAQHLDLRRAGPLIGGIPADQLTAAGAELAQRREWAVLAAFVGHIDAGVLTSLLGVFDAETLLRAAFLVEEPERIDALVATLGDGRIDDIHRAAHEHELWEESLTVFADLGAVQRKRFAAALGRVGDEHLDALVGVLAAEPALRAAAEPMLKVAPAAVKRRFA